MGSKQTSPREIAGPTRAGPGEKYGSASRSGTADRGDERDHPSSRSRHTTKIVFFREETREVDCRPRPRISLDRDLGNCVRNYGRAGSHYFQRKEFSRWSDRRSFETPRG